MENICSCEDPLLVSEDFFGSSQSVCQRCGNASETVDMLSSYDHGVHVPDHNKVRKTECMRDFFRLVDTYAVKLALSTEFRAQLKFYEPKVWELCRGKRNKDPYAVAVISVVLKKNSETFTMKELCHRFKVQINAVRSIYYMITGESYYDGSSSVSQGIRVVCKKCHVFLSEQKSSPPTLKQLTDLSFKIYELIKGDFITRQFKLPYFTASLCHIASKHFSSQSISNYDIIALFSLNRSRYATIASLVSRSLETLANRIPWKPKHITCKNIHLFLNDIIEFCAPSASDISTFLDDPELIKRKKREKLERAQMRLQLLKVEGSSAEAEDSVDNGGIETSAQTDLLSQPIINDSMDNGGERKEKAIESNVQGKRRSRESLSTFHLGRKLPLKKERKELAGELLTAPSIIDRRRTRPVKPVKTMETLDNEDKLMEELLARGCSVDEIMSEPYSNLSKLYFNQDLSGLDEELINDDGISDSEVDSYCLSAEEVKAKRRKMESLYTF